MTCQLISRHIKYHFLGFWLPIRECFRFFWYANYKTYKDKDLSMFCVDAIVSERPNIPLNMLFISYRHKWRKPMMNVGLSYIPGFQPAFIARIYYGGYCLYIFWEVYFFPKGGGE